VNQLLIKNHKVKPCTIALTNIGSLAQIKFTTSFSLSERF